MNVEGDLVKMSHGFSVALCRILFRCRAGFSLPPVTPRIPRYISAALPQAAAFSRAFQPQPHYAREPLTAYAYSRAFHAFGVFDFRFRVPAFSASLFFAAFLRHVIFSFNISYITPGLYRFSIDESF
jgi:hypothetical protein